MSATAAAGANLLQQTDLIGAAQLDAQLGLIAAQSSNQIMTETFSTEQAIGNNDAQAANQAINAKSQVAAAATQALGALYQAKATQPA